MGSPLEFREYTKKPLLKLWLELRIQQPFLYETSVYERANLEKLFNREDEKGQKNRLLKKSLFGKLIQIIHSYSSAGSPQHDLDFFPLPQEQGSFRPTFIEGRLLGKLTFILLSSRIPVGSSLESGATSLEMR